ncbi:MAG TPA: hypothetical protein VIJ63_23270 [Roseiarcus sp.]
MADILLASSHHGRRVLVTGAGQGIGAAFGRRGATVAVRVVANVDKASFIKIAEPSRTAIATASEGVF